MDKKLIYRFSLGIGLVIISSSLLSGCFIRKKVDNVPPEPQITEAQLRAYCPLVFMRDDTAFYNVYERGGDNDATKVIYQAAIRDVTRTCNTTDTTLSMKVAAAGRVVPGPMFKKGTVSLPIRVTVMQGDSVIYSKLRNYPVQINNGIDATQFIFSDDQISFPKPTAKNIRVFIGYDREQKK
ncbi:hypothetical protein [uncultured Bartonella sp.]|uniref:hypothetical protein n=1 Tax=uncultured Bartonella sp. TaxID=104108 RepID=UPI00261025C0|nr:hypothetical protein [uncultured Bartonella sp.]